MSGTNRYPRNAAPQPIMTFGEFKIWAALPRREPSLWRRLWHQHRRNNLTMVIDPTRGNLAVACLEICPDCHAILNDWIGSGER